MSSKCHNNNDVAEVLYQPRGLAFTRIRKKNA